MKMDKAEVNNKVASAVNAPVLVCFSNAGGAPLNFEEEERVIRESMRIASRDPECKPLAPVSLKVLSNPSIDCVRRELSRGHYRIFQFSVIYPNCSHCLWFETFSNRGTEPWHSV